MALGEIDPWHHKFWLSVRSCLCKKPRSNTIIHQFLQGIWFHTKREDGANTFHLLPPQRNCCRHNDKNTKVKVCSPDGDTEYFNIVAGLLQGDTLARYLFIIYLDYELKISIDLMKENSFKLAKERSRRYAVWTIMDTDSADDIVQITNTPAQSKFLLHGLEWAAGGVGLHVNANKMEYMCFNRRGDISTLKGGPLKLVDKFTYLRCSIS